MRGNLGVYFLVRQREEVVQRCSGLLSRMGDASLLGNWSNTGKEQAISYRGTVGQGMASKE